MKRKYISYFFIILLLISGLMNLNYHIKYSSPQYGFPLEIVKGIKGVVIQDSTPANFGQRSVLIKLKCCTDHNGNVATATGIIRTSYKGSPLYAGDKVSFYGKLSQYGYAAKRYDYKRKNYNTIRAAILENASAQLGSTPEANLIRMLLLGFSLEGENEIKEKARESGVSHVLALSGMHLVFFSSIISWLFYPMLKKDSKLIALLFLYLYVLVIGPKPSLIRALIFRSVYLCFKEHNSVLLLFLTFMIQATLMPSTIGELSTIYSYTALLGILAFAPIFDNLTPRFKPFFAYFSVSYSALIFTSIVSLKYFGVFYLGGMLISGVLTPLMFAFMGTGLVAIFYPRALSLATPLYKLFNKLLEYGGKCGKVETVKGYIIFTLPLLCILLLFCILRLYVEPKLRKP